jgi:hypothetical protein
MISNTQRSTIDLSAGPIDYIDTASDGPTVVLLHGVLITTPCGNEISLDGRIEGFDQDVGRYYRLGFGGAATQFSWAA